MLTPPRPLRTALLAAAALLPLGAVGALPATAATADALHAPSIERLDDASARGLAGRSTQGRIAGNFTLIQPTDAPWQVLLEWKSGFSLYTCGGSIIDAQHVITAAHCAQTALANASFAAGGMRVTAGDGQRVRAAADRPGASGVEDRPEPGLRQSQGRHDGRRRRHHGQPGIRPEQQPRREGHRPTDALGADHHGSAGPGAAARHRVRHHDDRWRRHGILRAVTTSPADPDDCSAIDENAIAICAHSPLGSSCSGDSGSGLTSVGANPVIVGVVSNGGDCGPDTDDFYVNLLAPENRAFIDKAVTGGRTLPPNARGASPGRP